MMSKRVCTIENIIQFVPAICFKSHQAKCNLKRVVFIQYLKTPFWHLENPPGYSWFKAFFAADRFIRVGV